MGRIDVRSLCVAITGASSGIGEATAKLLAQRGAAIGLFARRKQRLEALADECKRLGARAVVLVEGDVSKHADVVRFAAACKKELGPMDVVVANAGYGQIGNTLDMTPQEVQEVFQTNTVGAIWTVQAFAQQLEGRKGHAIVIGSVVSKIAVPYSSIYAASKWALRGWTRGARPELESRGIALTLLNPGYVRTEFFQARQMTQGVGAWNPGRGMTSEQVGKRILRAIKRRPAEVGMTWAHWFGVPSYRLMPILGPRILARLIRHRADSRFIGRSKPPAKK